MKQLLFVFICTIHFSAFSKEWKSLQQFQKETKQIALSQKDWLKSDRKQNTIVWQKANAYNLNHHHPEEYITIKQRRDFYAWFYTHLNLKGYEVIWPKMAHFISNKLRLIKAFPYNIFTNKSIKNYAYQGSETVFNQAFNELRLLYNSKDVIKGEIAQHWDEYMLYKEQYEWLEQIYQSIDSKSLKTIERMAKGKGFYGLMVDKSIRFKGDISNPEARYKYAIQSLRDYCKNTYK
ncbi:Insecticidal toxin complex protein [Lacinutrix iliipiscaria]|uniref:Insecticidal toxin complex protein n=1 Tax=Lacinutrix iliipiscaria TaxID=1230532 RepID=A0ABW5WPW3_9FLAO